MNTTTQQYPHQPLYHLPPWESRKLAKAFGKRPSIRCTRCYTKNYMYLFFFDWNGHCLLKVKRAL